MEVLKISFSQLFRVVFGLCTKAKAMTNTLAQLSRQKSISYNKHPHREREREIIEKK